MAVIGTVAFVIQLKGEPVYVRALEKSRGYGRFPDDPGPVWLRLAEGSYVNN